MNRIEPIRLIGRLNAISTFIENFPMNIIDINHAPSYASVFDFLIDILGACGVDVHQIASKVTEALFAIPENLGVGPNAIYDKISGMEVAEQSKFMSALEDGVKGIIMALLASIFSCSASPVLKTMNMDYSKYSMRLPYTDFSREGILIPKSLLNVFGHMDINPLTNEGKLYFNVEGAGDKYYIKQKRTEFITYDAETVTIPDCDKLSMVYVDFGPGHADFIAGSDLSTEDELQFRISTPVSKTITVSVTYRDGNGTPHSLDFNILPGEKVSEIFRTYPKDKVGNKCYIDSIQISGGNGSGTGTKITGSDGKVTYVYLSESESQPVIKFWNSQDNDSLRSIEWGTSTGCGTREYPISDAISEEMDIYEYVPAGEKVKDAVRVTNVPSSPDCDSPDAIVCYAGIDPNTLYRTNDMNAFLWYVANRGASKPQVESNKTVWDSRLKAKKFDVERKTSEDWNEWYNSKQSEYDEFSFRENDEKYPELFPILQLKKVGSDFEVYFPAQRYFKPTAKDNDSDFVYNNLRLNSTIYKFNYDYLQNIRIFQPKVILYGMYDALLNGALTAIMSLKPNFYRQETEAKLSSIIKRFIEADDAEVEDCYRTFSNEEFDDMLRDMLLSRYSATYTGGEVNRATQHDVEDYIAKIDSINLASSAAGETTKITKVLTEISSTGAEEGTIEYGFESNTNEGWWKRLIWAVTMPLIKALFTPQLIMLFVINFQVMGILSPDDLLGTNQDLIIRLISNKIFSLVRSIILYVKDMLAKMLLDFFFVVLLPKLEEYMLLLLKERLDYWIELLREALTTIPVYCNSIPINLFAGGRKSIQSIDDVKYAEIVDEQNKPESTGEC